MTSASNKGSVWHRWDPHIHTPATLQANRFAGDWEGYLSAIECARPIVEALGITEYCLLTGYKQFRARRASGRAANVAFVFPNVEFRLDVQTEKRKGINVHLIFSPDDPGHVEEIERVLSLLHFEYKGRTYRCTEADLAALGRAFEPSQTDNHGALVKGVEQFKLRFEHLRDAFRSDEWMQKNCLIAVDAGNQDGTSGLQNDGTFRALREELEAFAHIILSPHETDRAYWLGRKAGHGREVIERKYGGLKPCLHGCDAHRLDQVLKPDKDRRCWLRAELTFSGLRQTLLEPELRVAIGPAPPPGPSASECISSVKITNSTWLETSTVRLNDGLVAIIGPKGSGKTALADIVAHGAGVTVEDEASFLLKAADLLKDEEVALEWVDGTRDARRLDERPFTDDEQQPRVRYLSQQFVDRLCATEGMGEELLREIEAVVFRAIPDEERFGTADFRELRNMRLEQVGRMRDEKLTRIQELTAAIAAEDEKKAKLPKLEQKRKDQLAPKVETAERDIKALVPKDKKPEEIARAALIQSAGETQEKKLQDILVKIAKLGEMGGDVSTLYETVDRNFDGIKERYKVLGLSENEWRIFRPLVDKEAGRRALADRVRSLEVAEKHLVEGAPGAATDAESPATWPLFVLRARQKALADELGVEKNHARRYADLQKHIAALKLELAALDREIADAKEADARRKRAIEERRRSYVVIFELYAREQVVLEGLYGPLKEQLAGSEAEQQRRLEFYVRRHVDLDAWVERGENLLDLRRSGAFQGRGRLAEVAKAALLPSWQSGDPAAAGEAIDAFIAKHKDDFTACLRPSCRRQDLGEWLFSTDHISLAYGVRYDGVELSKLSPGMRGIVLLMLYLAIDQWDLRPLIVDQPEENLDPQSVYDELVGYFRSAKRRRQVVLVTHNPNLVVNADADQVIVAQAERKGAGLPRIRYASGGLEDEEIRAAVCRVLEGGERAFRERERRYNLPRDYRETR